MQSRKDKTGYWLIVDKGEELKSAIAAFAKEKGIAGASLCGIGAVTQVELAAFSPEKNEFSKRKFPDYYELLSITGNINEDGVHAHLVISDLDFNVHGGHLERAFASTFAEIFIIPTSPLKKLPMAGGSLKKISLERQ